MKKIIRSSAIVLGVCFFATTAKAQMASDQPSQAAKVVEAAKVNKTTAVKPAEVQTASSVSVQSAPVAKPIVVKDVEAAKVATAVANPMDAQGVIAAPVLASEAKVATPAPDPKKAIIQE